MSVRFRSPAQSQHRAAARLLGERGAAAVEFALVAPVLILLLLGIMEFSKVFNTQATLSAAAREGARVVALGYDHPAARDVVTGAANGLAVPASNIRISYSKGTTCLGVKPEDKVTVTITVDYHQAFLSGFMGGAGKDLAGKAVMRCGG